MTVFPVVGAAVVGCGVTEDVAVALGAEDGDGTIVVPVDTALLPPALGTPGSFEVRAPFPHLPPSPEETSRQG